MPSQGRENVLQAARECLEVLVCGSSGMHDGFHGMSSAPGGACSIDCV